MSLRDIYLILTAAYCRQRAITAPEITVQIFRNVQ